MEDWVFPGLKISRGEFEAAGKSAYKILRANAGHEEAQDAIQWAWLKAAEGRLERQSSEGLLRWVVQCGKHIIIDRARRQRRRREQSWGDRDLRDEKSPDPYKFASAGEEGGRVLAALDKVERVYRETMILHYFEGRGCKEIAQKCGVAVGTVLSRLNRGRAQFREIYLAAEAKAA